MKSFWCFYCCLWTYFTPFFRFYIVDYEQVNVSEADSFCDLILAWKKHDIKLKTEKLLSVTSLNWTQSAVFQVRTVLCFFMLVLSQEMYLHGNCLLWITLCFASSYDTVWKTTSCMFLASFSNKTYFKI